MVRRSLPLLGFLVAACVGDAPVVTPGADAGIDSTANDAASDAVGDVVSEAAPSWCAQNHPTATVCDDFDTGSPKAGWSNGLSGAGTVTVGTTPALSGGHALRSATPLLTSTSAEARLHRVESTGGGTHHWILEADVYVDIVNVLPADAGTPTTMPVLLSVQTATGKSAVLQYRPATGLAFFAGYATVIGTDQPFAKQQWHHVTLDIKLVGSAYDVSGTIDNGTPQTAAQLQGQVSSTTTLDVGLFSVGPMGGLEVVYDNVVLTTAN